jgi:hypothetical protein
MDSFKPSKHFLMMASTLGSSARLHINRHVFEKPSGSSEFFVSGYRFIFQKKIKVRPILLLSPTAFIVLVV